MDINKWAREHIILRVIAGSRLYGTAREDSDTDYRGVCLDPPESIIGSVKFEQIQFDHGADEVIYSVSKFIRLCMDANPSILDILFAPVESVVFAAKPWMTIKENKQKFLSQKVRHTFSGYAFSQLKRIERHKRWIDNPPIAPTLEEYGLQLHSSKSGGQKITPIKDHVNDSTAISAYENATRDYKNYRRWRDGRNPKRAALEDKYGYDVKHAGHLVRLLLQGNNILRDASYNPVLKGVDLVLVREVMNGEWAYEDLIRWAKFQEELVKTRPTCLRKTPDINAINRIRLEMTAISLGLDEDFCKLSAVYCNAED